jgi:cyclopropane fatty-acyl-phospholipid synthase-like methyltransferase
MKAPSAELSRNIQDYVSRHRGKLYAPIPHPALSHIRYKHGPERFDLIAPHLEFKNGTVLDIGSRFGYMAHRLEELGYKVTAVERSRVDVYFMLEIHDLCARKFNVVHDTIFNVTELEYDIVFALNIFHHFMKTKETFEQLDAFLRRLKCRMMIYQAHDPSEPQMDGAYRNMTPEQATRFLSERLSLPGIVEIGSYRRSRKILNFTVPRIVEFGSYRKTRRIFKLNE